MLGDIFLLNFLDKVRDTIKKYELFSSGDRVLIGVSGGIDSVVLLDTLFLLQEELQINLAICHLNHMFRGEEAKGDADFVAFLAKKYNLKFYGEEIDVTSYKKRNKLSSQMAAREVRYDFFNRAMKLFDINKLALAHHEDDRAETVLMNILKGAGISGLKGILPKRENIVRPLIEVSRVEIGLYLEKRGLFYREDSSNYKTVYMRNKVRQKLIPYLKEYNPMVVKSLNHLAEIAKDENAYLEEMSDLAQQKIIIEKNESKIIISLNNFQDLPISLKRRILRNLYYKITQKKVVLDYRQLENTLNFLADEKILCGQKVLPSNVLLYKRYGRLEITKEAKATTPSYSYQLNIPGITFVSEINQYIEAKVIDILEAGNPKEKASREVLLDYQALNYPLTVRKREDGDLFQPLGLPNKMKLKNFLINRKIARELRDNLPLVISGEEIAWVGGVCPGEKFKVSEKTIKCINLKII